MKDIEKIYNQKEKMNFLCLNKKRIRIKIPNHDKRVFILSPVINIDIKYKFNKNNDLINLFLFKYSNNFKITGTNPITRIIPPIINSSE